MGLRLNRSNTLAAVRAIFAHDLQLAVCNTFNDHRVAAFGNLDGIFDTDNGRFGVVDIEYYQSFQGGCTLESMTDRGDDFLEAFRLFFGS